MSLFDLSNIKKIFREEQDNQTGSEVFRELLLLVLARATDADAYTHPAEVEVVQKVLQERLGEHIESSDIRIAANSKLYESAPLQKYISRAAPRLPKADRVAILHALVEVLKADGQVASSEASYFNMVAAAMNLDYADVAGFISRAVNHSCELAARASYLG